MKARLLLVVLGVLLVASIAAAQPVEEFKVTVVMQARDAANVAAPLEEMEIRLKGRSLVAVARDPDVTVTVQKGGQLLKISDQKTGQSVELDAAQFQLILAEGKNRVPIAGSEFTLMRGDRAVAVVRRGVPSATPATPPPLTQRTRPRGPVPPPGDEVRRFEGHQDAVVSVGFSPDGRRAISASCDGTIYLWDAVTSREIRRYQMPGQIYAVALSADGRRIACGGIDGRVRLWEAETGREIRQISQGGWVQALAILSQGDRVLAGGNPMSPEKTIRKVGLWDMTTGGEIHSFEYPMDFVTSFSLSRDERRAACTGGYSNNSDTPLDAMLLVWDLESGKAIFQWKPPIRTSLRQAAISPDGRMVLAEDTPDGRRLAMWEVDSGTKVRSFPDVSGIEALAISADGRRVLAGTANPEIHLLDLESGRLLATFRGQVATCLAFSPDGGYALSGGRDHTVRLWRLPGAVPATMPAEKPRPAEKAMSARPAREVRRFQHDNGVASVAFSPDGQRALSGANLDLRLWDVESGREIRRFHGDKAYNVVNSLAWSPDGRYALLGAGQYLNTQRLSLWDVEAWREIRVYEQPDSVVTCVAFSRDGRLGLSGTVEGTAYAWDIESGREISRYKPPTRDARGISLAANGRLAAYAGGYEDPRIRLWNVQSGKEVRLLEGHIGPVASVAFLPDGNRLLSGGADHMLRLWDTDRGTQIRSVLVPDDVTCVAVTPDGRHALSGSLSGTMRVWDLESGREVESLIGHSKRITSLAISPNGRQALSGSDDQTMRLWALPEPKQP
jgi:WD40 repeat protein